MKKLLGWQRKKLRLLCAPVGKIYENRSSCSKQYGGNDPRLWNGSCVAEGARLPTTTATFL